MGPVNNKRIFNLGTSSEKSITINRETIWFNDTSVTPSQLVYRTHAINEFTCPSTFTSNGKTFSLSFSGDNVTITNQGSGGWSQDAEVTCAKKCGKARNEYHQNGATDDADCHWKAGGDLFHNGADTSIDSTNTRNFCWLYDTNHGMRPTAAGNGNSQYTCFTKDWRTIQLLRRVPAPCRLWPRTTSTIVETQPSVRAQLTSTRCRPDTPASLVAGHIRATTTRDSFATRPAVDKRRSPAWWQVKTTSGGSISTPAPMAGPTRMRLLP